MQVKQIDESFDVVLTYNRRQNSTTFELSFRIRAQFRTLLHLHVFFILETSM